MSSTLPSLFKRSTEWIPGHFRLCRSLKLGLYYDLKKSMQNETRHEYAMMDTKQYGKKLQGFRILRKKVFSDIGSDQGNRL